MPRKKIGKNYTFIDVELANSSRASICSIGIVYVPWEGDTIEYYTLVNPEADFTPQTIRVHGIRPEDVTEAPTFPSVWSKIEQYFSGSIVVAHNAAAVDLNALSQSLIRYDIACPSFQFLDTREIAKRALPCCCSYALDDVCDAVGVTLDDHHNALSDAKACRDILFALLAYDPAAKLRNSVYCYDVTHTHNNVQIHGGIKIAEYEPKGD